MEAAVYGGLLVFGFFILLWMASIEVRLRRQATILGPITAILKLAHMIAGQKLFADDGPPLPDINDNGDGAKAGVRKSG